VLDFCAFLCFPKFAPVLFTLIIYLLNLRVFFFLASPGYIGVWTPHRMVGLHIWFSHRSFEENFPVFIAGMGPFYRYFISQKMRSILLSPIGISYSGLRATNSLFRTKEGINTFLSRCEYILVGIYIFLFFFLHKVHYYLCFFLEADDWSAILVFVIFVKCRRTIGKILRAEDDEFQ